MTPSNTLQDLVRALAYSSSDWRDHLTRDPVLRCGETLDCLMVLFEAAANAGSPVLEWQPEPEGCARDGNYLAWRACRVCSANIVNRTRQLVKASPVTDLVP